MKIVERAMDVLFAFAVQRRALSVDDLEARLGLPRSTLYRFVKALQRQGLLDVDGVPGHYRLGGRILELAHGVDTTLALREAARPVLEDLATQTGETIFLTIVSGGRGVCVDRILSPSAVAFHLEIGRSHPLHAGAATKVLLAYLPDRERERILLRPLEQFTPFTVTDPATLRRQCVEIRRRRFAYTAEEADPGVRAVAAPVFTAASGLAGSLCVAGPAQRFPQALVPDRARLVIDSALRISRRLGWQPAPDVPARAPRRADARPRALRLSGGRPAHDDGARARPVNGRRPAS